MPTLPSTPEDDLSTYHSAKAKEKRAQDAEKIRQDFIKSQHLPVKPVTAQQPSIESSEDEY